MSRDQGRGTAAAAHLGVPFFGPLLPLLIFLTVTHQPLVRGHARQALAFQVAFFAVYVCLTMAMFADVVPTSALPLALAIALVLELPQIGLALTGREPIRLIPG